MYEDIKEKTVLVVDDSPISLKQATAILKDKYRVACAKSGRMAFVYLERQKPDIILLDLNMPEMDGTQVYKKLREDEATKDIPVFFLTGLDDRQYAEKLFGIPEEMIIQKPPQPAYLIMRITQEIG